MVEHWNLRLKLRPASILDPRESLFHAESRFWLSGSWYQALGVAFGPVRVNCTHAGSRICTLCEF